jgi:hypothetical protein
LRIKELDSVFLNMTARSKGETARGPHSDAMDPNETTEVEMADRRRDRLLAALIEKLPAPGCEWDRSQRVAWLDMMAMAFDVVYGRCAAAPVAPLKAGDDATASPGLAAPRSFSLTADGASADGPARQFYVDHDGFAMGDARPIAMEDLPEGATLWDERSGLECGDVTTILWRDIGTTRKSLPHGVLFKAAEKNPQRQLPERE